jgi:plastocyanin
MRKLILLASLATLACGGDDTTNPPVDGGGDFTVSVVNNAFNPGNLSVPVGTAVNWQWNSGGVAHNVTFEDQAPGSGDRTTGSFSRTFSATGDYAYHCTLHPPNMVGTVSVTASTTGGTGTGGGGGGGSYP